MYNVTDSKGKQKIFFLAFFAGSNLPCNDKQLLLSSLFPAEVICSVVCAKDQDVASVASSASAGFKTWSELSCYQRAKVLRQY